MMECTVLGTSSSVPTKKRNHPGVHLKFRDTRILFDCGECTQRQMTVAGLSIQKLSGIMVSHLHADHYLGLAGIIQTLAFREHEKKLLVNGPKGIGEIVEFFVKWSGIPPKFPITVTEGKLGMVYEDHNVTVESFPLAHDVPTYGYRITEKVEYNLDPKKLEKHGLLNSPLCRELKDKGQVKFRGKTIKLSQVAKPLREPVKVVIAMDTKPCKSLEENARGADLLICESTFSEKLKEKAHKYNHMTAKDAARVAKKAGVEKLVLMHYSSRYKDEKLLEREAREIFKNTDAAHDFYKASL